jgi:hypothetical protein
LWLVLSSRFHIGSPEVGKQKRKKAKQTFAAEFRYKITGKLHA